VEKISPARKSSGETTASRLTPGGSPRARPAGDVPDFRLEVFHRVAPVAEGQRRQPFPETPSLIPASGKFFVRRRRASR
jgi:hypothetical protein